MTFRLLFVGLGAFLFAASVHADELGVLRGSKVGGDFACTIAGAAGEDTCDASTASDGTSCVWCELSSFGFCVSEDQADTMKKTIPGLSCDDSDDDDDAVPDDDDDNNDDNVPDDYWECLKNYSDADSCGDGGCTWCDTKAGYGLCMDTEAAQSASKSDWFDCKFTETKPVSFTSPDAMSCLPISLQGDQELCEKTVDASGASCEWCSMDDSINLCLNRELADVAVKLGVCSGNLEDPFDTSCLAASVEGDESSCEAATDSDGNPCEWCSVNQVPLCLTSDQAGIAQALGGECSSDSVVKPKNEKASDPFDTSCLAASVEGDEADCEAATDSDGNPCEWCSVNQVPLCLNSDQAQMAQALGGECSTSNTIMTMES